MTDFFPALISAILQVALISLIPFTVWIIAEKKKGTKYSCYVGMTKPVMTGKWYWLLLVCVVYYAIYSMDIRSLLPIETISQYMASSEDVTINSFKGQGFSVMGKMFLTAFVNNGFTEELLFRGFICKRLMKICGNNYGILLQGIVFALIHNLMFATIVPHLGFHIILFVFVTSMSTLLALLNEKFFGGSIWPSVILHGLGNFCSYAMAAFS